MAALRDAFDLRSATIGALLMGLLVAAINLRHGLPAAMTAAGKQAAYTFFIAGLILKLCERLALAFPERRRALIVATVVPSLVTVGATSLVHHLRGTAEPWASVLPTLLMGPPSFAAWAIKSCRAGAPASTDTDPKEPPP